MTRELLGTIMEWERDLFASTAVFHQYVFENTGFCNVFVYCDDGVRGWLYHLAVASEFRRRGFATGLVRAAEDGLRRLGCPKVNLQIRPTNHEVVAFYRSVGYEVEERVSMGRRL